MVLFTCTIASFVAQRGVQNIALRENTENIRDDDSNPQERIHIPISNAETVDELGNLRRIVKSQKK